MNLLDLENPVFEVYAVAAAIMVLKVMLQGWMTVYRMLRSNSGLASPEDLKKGLINKTRAPSSWKLMTMSTARAGCIETILKIYPPSWSRAYCSLLLIRLCGWRRC